MGHAKRAEGQRCRKGRNTGRKVRLTIKYRIVPPIRGDQLARWFERVAKAWVKWEGELAGERLESLQSEPGFAELSEYFKTLEAMLSVTTTPQRSRAP